jgi:hypothetical protein
VLMGFKLVAFAACFDVIAKPTMDKLCFDFMLRRRLRCN